MDSQSIGPNIFFDKTTAAQVHGSNFVTFDFLENVKFFWNPVESSDFPNSVT